MARAATARALPAPVRPRTRPKPKPRAKRKVEPRRRVAGGVVWIGLVAALLAGVVALNVAVLRLNVRLDQTQSERNQLRADNAQLNTEIAAKAPTLILVSTNAATAAPIRIPRTPRERSRKASDGMMIPKNIARPPSRGIGIRWTRRSSGTSTAPRRRAIPATAGVSRTVITRAVMHPQTISRLSVSSAHMLG